VRLVLRMARSKASGRTSRRAEPSGEANALSGSSHDERNRGPEAWTGAKLQQDSPSWRCRWSQPWAGIFITFAGPAFTESYEPTKFAPRLRSWSLPGQKCFRCRRSAPHRQQPLENTSGEAQLDRRQENPQLGAPRPVLPSPLGDSSTITFVTNGTVSSGSASIVPAGDGERRSCRSLT
jgi:hypothetical protein